MTPQEKSVPYALCICGCGQRISARATKYVHGHNAAHPRVDMRDARAFKIDGVYCKLLPLNRNMWAIVDVEDFDRFNQHKWTAVEGDRAGAYYAICQWVRGLGKAQGVAAGRVLILHREILGLRPGDPLEGDHINGATLDCRRKNLRIAPGDKNRKNRARGRNNTSGIKGVSWLSRSAHWVARIQVDGRMIYLGSFAEKESAGAAYLKAALHYYGEFARSL